MLMTINQNLLPQPIADARAKFLAVKGNKRNLKTAYNQLQKLVWDTVIQNPTDKILYELLTQLEYEYCWKRKDRPHLEAKQHRDIQIRKIWEFSLEYNPDWAESRYYLGHLEADAGRCETACEYFLAGIRHGIDNDYVEKCFRKFLQISPLGAADLRSINPYPACDFEGISFQVARERMEADWVILQTLEHKLQNTQSLDIQADLSMINALVRRSLNAWGVLQELLNEQQKNSLTYQHLKKVIWPYSHILSEPYEPKKFASLLGLENDFDKLSLLEQIKWDYALQRIFLLVDAPTDVLDADKSTWDAATTFDKKLLTQRRFSLGEFDETVKLLSHQQSERRVRIDDALAEYDRLWSVYTDVAERLEAMHDIACDYEGYGKEAWLELAGAAKHQLWIGINMLDLAQYLPIYITDLVRRIVEQQPWLGRYLTKQENLRPWLRNKSLLSAFERDTRYREIDDYLHTIQTGNWQGVAATIQLFVQSLEVHVRSESQLSKQSMPAILGTRVWNWLDQESQLSLNNAEHRHISEMLVGDNPNSPEKDYAGFYLLYHKAFEATLRRVIGEYTKARIKRNSPKRRGPPRFADLLDCLKNFRDEQPNLPIQSYLWAKQLAQRGEQVQTQRNKAVHQQQLAYKDYESLRHHLLGVLHENQRKVSVFWLAYALDTAIHEQS